MGRGIPRVLCDGGVTPGSVSYRALSAFIGDILKWMAKTNVTLGRF